MFLLTQIIILSASLPLAVIAAYGYRDAPFGSVLKPLVPVVVAYLLLAVVELLYPAWSVTATPLLGGIGLALVGWTTVQLVLLLTGRKAV